MTQQLLGQMLEFLALKIHFSDSCFVEAIILDTVRILYSYVESIVMFVLAVMTADSCLIDTYRSLMWLHYSRKCNACMCSYAINE